MVTKKDILKAFGNCSPEQIGSKQLFIIESDIPTGYFTQCLVSYLTVVGYVTVEPAGKVWNLTKKKYSQTTSKQLSQFANSLIRQGKLVRYI
jgi:hypothetical protein